MKLMKKETRKNEKVFIGYWLQTEKENISAFPLKNFDFD